MSKEMDYSGIIKIALLGGIAYFGIKALGGLKDIFGAPIAGGKAIIDATKGTIEATQEHIGDIGMTPFSRTWDTKPYEPVKVLPSIPDLQIPPKPPSVAGQIFPPLGFVEQVISQGPQIPSLLGQIFPPLGIIETITRPQPKPTTVTTAVLTRDLSTPEGVMAYQQQLGQLRHHVGPVQVVNK
jgi:hypothetical protein